MLEAYIKFPNGGMYATMVQAVLVKIIDDYRLQEKCSIKKALNYISLVREAVRAAALM